MPEPISLPRVGMLATVRQRRGIVTAVEPYGARGERLSHLVRVEYTDTDGPPDDTLLWEHEPRARLLEPTALPRIADRPALRPAELDALVRTVRWGALVPLVKPEDPALPAEPAIAAPLFGALEVDDFQLVPLSRALAMPRVSLLLADDVGLGKTIEAGLVLNELLLRRRIRRVLILTPAALRTQWQDEMQSKLALPFELVDRAETHALQKSGSGSMRARGARTAASSPRTTTCGSRTCWSSSSRRAGPRTIAPARRPLPTCRGTS